MLYSPRCAANNNFSKLLFLSKPFVTPSPKHSYTIQASRCCCGMYDIHQGYRRHDSWSGRVADWATSMNPASSSEVHSPRPFHPSYARSNKAVSNFPGSGQRNPCCSAIRGGNKISTEDGRKKNNRQKDHSADIGETAMVLA
jgi:hypothetical protein